MLANTENSVDRLVDLIEEQTYLCAAQTAYVTPKRAINAHGQWRIIGSINLALSHKLYFSVNAKTF